MRNSALFRSDEEIVSIGHGFLNRSLPRSAWTHVAHFAAVFWLGEAHPEMDLSKELPHLIRAYNVATGVENTDESGYHATISTASLRAARFFRSGRLTEPLFVTCNALIASPFGISDWILKYWTRETLFSLPARRAWVEPDLEMLPF